MQSFKAEILTVNDPKWYSTSLRFATESEADQYGLDLILRWTASRDYRVVESEDSITYRITGDGLERIEKGDE